MAAVAAAVGDAERALRFSGAAEVRRAEIGTPRSPSDAEKLADTLARAYELLSTGEQEQALEAGRALGLEAAVEEALEVCAQVVAG